MWHGFVTFLYKASIVCAVGAHGADLATTEHCIGAGKCQEMNPWLARFNEPAKFGFAKMGVASAGLIGVNRFYQLGVDENSGKKKAIAISANFAQCAAFGAIAKHNSDVARGKR